MSTVCVQAPFSTSSDHNTVNFTVTFDHLRSQAESPTLAQQRRYLWKQGDYAAMSQYLKAIDWSSMFSINFTPDALWRAFCDVLSVAVDMFVPSILVSNRRNRRQLKRYPAKIRALFAKKRCLWK